MLRLASWIRECDDAWFGKFLTPHREIVLGNARLGPVDPASADGLLITGGADVAAEFHSEPPANLSLIQNPDPVRDAWEFAAVRSAIERGIPIFCICKGMQVLNLALGGTLFPDIRGHDLAEMKTANIQPLRFDTIARHRVEKVNSSHHQALDRVAEMLEIEAWHAGDGIIEQVRIRNYPWSLGVQYHPERDSIYTSLFEDFFGQLTPTFDGR